MSNNLYVRLTKVQPDGCGDVYEGILVIPPTEGISLWLNRKKKNGEPSEKMWHTSTVQSFVRSDSRTCMVHTLNSTYKMEILDASGNPTST